jgi:TetR/AcrR family transcriptional repressor of lmrAB and yxaGH operons
VVRPPHGYRLTRSRGADRAPRTGCAVAAVAMDVDEKDEGNRAAAHTIFHGWASRLSYAFVSAGQDHAQAEDLSTYLIGLLEGAHVLCRTAGTTDPFERIARSALRHMSR